MSIFDAIWRRRGRPHQHELDGAEEDLPVRHITMTDRDYADLLETGDVALKFWLPDLVGIMLDQSCKFANTTRSDFIRQNLFIYLYGRYDLMGLLEQRNHYYRLDPPSRMMFSRSAAPKSDTVSEPEPDIMQDLGKNTEDLKVWIPVKMKEDIQKLADKASISLSEMIREIIISTLFGHTYLSARKELMQMEIEIEGESGN
jgi:hypothetical protein